MSKKTDQNKLQDTPYSLGHTDEVEYEYQSPTGLDEDLIRKMCSLKHSTVAGSTRVYSLFLVVTN